MPYIDMEGTIPSNLSPFETYQAYNCLDSAVTTQLLPVMKNELNPNTARTYKREMNVLALCLEMSTKGFPVDQWCLAELLHGLEQDSRKALHHLHAFCGAIGAEKINPRSPIAVPALFYDYMRIPVIWKFDRKTGQRKRAADIKALETIRTNYPSTTPFINAILSYREVEKLIGVFKRGLEPGTGNLRCNFSPSGTETGRLSSQQNPYQRGTNAQNLTDRARQVITAPEGYAILNFDLKTAESTAVGFISGDEGYLEACLSGDLHTSVAKLNWRSLPWTGDLKLDRAIAEQPYYRQFSYRDMAKRGGHGTNYYGTPRTMATHLKLPTKVLAEFQAEYFATFPGIPEWHVETIRRVQQDGFIITRLGRERRFWGRSDDPATHREAIAFEPQSLVADVMNQGLLQAQAWVLQNLKTTNRLIADLRAQVHDAGVFLVPLDALAEVTPLIQKKLEVPVDFGNKGTMLIPNDVMVGKRWCKAAKKGKGYMLEGLKDYSPGQELHWL